MIYLKRNVLLILTLVSLKLIAQNGNKDYSDSPIPNNGPNIIFIYVDDLGYGDLGNFWQNQRTGSKKMLTPMLDKMANEGAMLTHHYTAAPVCAPARASLLEGLHQGHSSIRNSQFDKALKDGLNLAQMLMKSGYRTMHVGKAGLAGARNVNTMPFLDPTTLQAHPLKRGFDQFFGYLYHQQGHAHYPVNGTTNKVAYFTDGYSIITQGTEKTYTTDTYTAKTKQWITTHENTRPEQPFFMYLAYDVPHSILEVPTQAYPAGFGLTGGVQWTGATSPTPWVNTASGTRDTFIHPDYAGKSWNATEKRFATMIRRLDNAVEDVIQLLKDLNIDDETLIVFSSDNGPHSESSTGAYRQNPQSFQSYGNFNGIKRDLWEGGIRMPTVCRYPGKIPVNTEVTLPSGQWDWLATFAELAQVAVPAYTDGVSLMPSLEEDNSNQIHKEYTYHEYAVGGTTPSYNDFEASKRGRTRNQMQVIRIGDYKGIRYNIQNHSTPFEIYNVVTDERETTNLRASMPALHQQMLNKVLQSRKSNGSALRPYDNELIPSSTNTANLNGLEKRVFSGKHEWTPNFEYLTPISTAVTSGINVDANGLSSEFGLFYNGFIELPTDGTYTFYLQSASKCHVQLHDIHLLDNDFTYTSGELSATLTLKAGKHPIRIFYQQNSSVTPNILLKLQGPGIPKSAIPNTMFFVDNVLGINDFESNYNLQVYPNPVSNKLQVLLHTKENTKCYYNIYTATGQELFEKDKMFQVNPGVNTIDVSVDRLKSGIYFLKFKFEGANRNITKKIIKI